MTIQEHEPGGDELLSDIQLVFYGTQTVPIPLTNVSNPIAIDSISMLFAHIPAQPTTEPSNVGHPSNGLHSHTAYPWAEIVALCAAQPGFVRLQLGCGSLDHLVQFMEAERAAFGKLHGRIALFYYAKDGGLRAADFETLADLGGTSVLL